ncbi:MULTISPECIES: tyrosine-type recombinase/integrase [Sporosarcina]|uniref:tyrosine-type recombinase/integrase n=1 Tax=Sporosarcina TaxID=1569 RepID=UPI0030D4F83E
MDELVIDAFRKHKGEQEKLIKRFGNSYYNEEFVFANYHRYPGYPILIKLVETRMARLLKKVDLNLGVTPHSFRHTHTSLLAEAGVGLEEIMDRLGHQDDEVTRNVYLHVTNEMKKEASNKFSELMRSIA